MFALKICGYLKAIIYFGHSHWKNMPAASFLSVPNAHRHFKFVCFVGLI